MRGCMTGIDPDYDYLYDPQRSDSYCRCPVCGMEIYAEGESLCAACKEMEDKNAE